MIPPKPRLPSQRQQPAPPRQRRLVRFPNGGTLGEVADRATRRLAELAQQHPSQSVAVVTHRVVLKVILCQIRWGGNECFWDVQLDTASISLIEFEGDAIRIVRENDSSHLASMAGEGGKVDF